MPDQAPTPPPSLWPAVLSALSEGVVVQLSDGQIEWANAAAEALLGLTLAQLQGRDSMDPRWAAIHPDGSPFPGEDHPAMRTLRTGTPLDGVMMGVQLPEGGRRWLRISTRPVSWVEGEAGVVSTFTDVTQEHWLTQRLEDENEKLHATQKLARVGHWSLPADGGPARLSPTMQGLLDLAGECHPIDQVLGRFAPLSQLALTAALDGLAAGQEAFVSVNFGAPAAHSALVRLARRPDGRLLGTLQDLTAVKALEAQAARAQTLHNLAVDGAKLGTWEWLVDEGVVLVNAHWCTMIGLPVVERLPFDVWQDSLHPEDLARIVAELDAVLGPEAAPLLYEYRLRHADGRWIHVMSSGRVIERHPDGRPARLSGINLDLTDRRSAEAQAAVQRQALEALDQAVLVADRDGQVQRANRAARALFGLEPDARLPNLGRLLAARQLNAGDLNAALSADQAWAGELGTGAPDGLILHARLEAPAAPGGPRPLVLHDVTAQRRAEATEDTDPLTGVPNRRGLRRALDAALADAQPFALVFLDLDGFKPVNDRHGHGVGDALLQAIAQRLQTQLRPHDCLTRYGGDEFVGVIRHVRTHSSSDAAAQRLRAACSRPVTVGELVLTVGASVGVARYPSDAQTAAGLIDCADARMMTMKRARADRRRRTAPPTSPLPDATPT